MLIGSTKLESVLSFFLSEQIKLHDLLETQRE